MPTRLHVHEVGTYTIMGLERRIFLLLGLASGACQLQFISGRQRKQLGEPQLRVTRTLRTLAGKPLFSCISLPGAMLLVSRSMKDAPALYLDLQDSKQLRPEI